MGAVVVLTESSVELSEFLSEHEATADNSTKDNKNREKNLFKKSVQSLVIYYIF